MDSLFPSAFDPEEAGLPPLQQLGSDWRSAPPLQGAALKAFWNKHLATGPDLKSTRASRVHAAWRITRQLSICRGIIKADQPIEAVSEGVDVTDPTFTSFNEVRDLQLRSLLAAGVPVAKPEDKDALDRFLALVDFFGSACLALDQHHSTQEGFAHFLTTQGIYDGWPSLLEISAHECELIEQTMDMLTGSASDTVMKELRAGLGLLPAEANQLRLLAKRALVNRIDFEDREGFKALTIARLERLQEKAEQAFDHRGAAMIGREMFRVFDAKAAQDIADEFGDMSNVIARSAERRRLPSPEDL